MSKLISAIKAIARFVKRAKGWLLLGLAGVAVAYIVARFKMVGNGADEEVYVDLTERLAWAKKVYAQRLEALKTPQSADATVDEFNKRFGG